MPQTPAPGAARADRYLSLEVARFLAALFVALGHLARLLSGMGVAAIDRPFQRFSRRLI